MAKTKRERDREANYKVIEAAARALFIDEGYEATSLSRCNDSVKFCPGDNKEEFTDEY